MTVRFRHVVTLSAAAALVVGFAACDKSPTTPSRLPGPGQGPIPPPPVTTVRVELVAPSDVAPGESVQLTLNAVKSDGSVENVSGQATWTSGTDQVLGLTSTGLATGRAAGESLVTGRFANRTANRQLLVLPKGTFRLKGVIADDAAGIEGLGIENVGVTVIGGVGEGTTVFTKFDGSYALYGVAGQVRLHAKKDGYFNALQEVNVTQHASHNFAMTPERPRQKYDGTYELTISAAPCSFSRNIPEPARRRVYTADARQDGTRLTVTLKGADFIQTDGHGAGFSGILDGTESVKFTIGSAYYYYYYSHGYFDIVERFDNGAFVVGNGIASLRGTPERLSGTFSGTLAVSPRISAPFWPFGNNWCFASAHGFEMVRR
jgi:hypothetical protein